MIETLREWIRQTFFEGAPRSIQAKQNIVALFFLRGISVCINFVLVPLTLGYLSDDKYGLWMTLSSILGWVMWLDIGLGNGLRNKFAVALAHNDRVLARTYVSTTYLFVGGISVLLFLLYLAIHPFLSWSGILNAPPAMGPELAQLALVVMLFFSIRLVAGLISTVLVADQQPALSALLEVFVNALSLGATLVLTHVLPGSLLWLGGSLATAMVIVPLAGNLILFRTKYREFAPSFRFVNVAHARGLMQIGAQFFVLQLAGMVLFTSSNILITQLFGPAEVTQYNIAYKYFGIPSMVFTILLTPFWSAYTEAFARADYGWIERSFKRLKQILILFTIGVVIMVFFADRFYDLWLRRHVNIPFSLSAAMGAYVVIVAWSSIFSYFINGTGKIRLQLFVAVLISAAMIPLALLLAGPGGLRTTGVVLALCTVLLPGAVLWPIQSRKLLSGRAHGIWTK
jgi:O-antigen/teichoic acid export membrane protein